MRLILDVYDVLGNRVGDGPVMTLAAAQVTRLLDGVGTIQFETPATDERALMLLVPRARFRLRTDYQGVVREIGRGTVLTREMRENESGAVLVYEAADALADLRRYTTYIGRTYSQQAVADVVFDLVGLVPGWSADVEPDAGMMVIDARFDGVSVLDALRELCENTGLHFRLAGSGDVVEVGLFGTSSGVTAINAETAASDLYRREQIALVSSINAGEDAEDVVNWVEPLGAGEDAARLTLRDSTRTSPYPILTTTGPDGRMIYYLEDSASIAAYGRYERTLPIKNISPIDNTEADKIAAANALYDAAVAWLSRMKDLRKSYDLNLTGVKDTLRAGDTLRVRYRGRVEKHGRPVDYAVLDEDMYLLRVTETYGLETAGSVSAEISNVDSAAMTVEEAIIRSMNETVLRGLRPAVGMGCRSFVYPREIAPAFPCTVPVEITNATLDVVRVRVRLRTMPLRATAIQGDHRHAVFQLVGTMIAPQPANWLVNMFRDAAGAVGTVAGIWYNGPATVGQNLYTHGAAGAVEYGVQDDTVTPTYITLWINGTDRTADFGGPWAPSGGGIDVLMDVGLMTYAIVHATGGMYQSHTVEFRAGSGHGRCEVTVEIYEVLQGIDPA